MNLTQTKPERDTGDRSARTQFAEHALLPFVDTVRARANGDDPPIPLPEDWPELRRLFGGGWRRGLYVIAGRTGSGRTALALQAACAARTALYVSLELGADELLARLLARTTDIAWPRLLWGGDDSGPLAASELEAVSGAAEELGHELRQRQPEALVFFEPSPDERYVDEIARQAKMVACIADGRPPLVVVDYLQLLRGADSRNGRELREQVRSSAYALRELTRPRPEQFWPGCAVLLLSSIARGGYTHVENTEALRKASDGDLLGLAKESGDVEYSADFVFALAVDALEYRARHRRALLRLAKGRASPAHADGVELMFHGALAYYEEAGRAELRADDDEERLRAIERYVEDHPGASKAAIVSGVGGKTIRTRELVEAAVGRRLIHRGAHGQGYAHYPAVPGRAQQGHAVNASADAENEQAVPGRAQQGHELSPTTRAHLCPAVPNEGTRLNPSPAKPEPEGEGSLPVGESLPGTGGDGDNLDSELPLDEAGPDEGAWVRTRAETTFVDELGWTSAPQRKYEPDDDVRIRPERYREARDKGLVA